jgi:hypothetical protein
MIDDNIGGVMRIIIAGSREFNNYAVLKHNVINVLLILSPAQEPNVEIVSGTARGADQLGERFAKEYKYPVKRFPADWDTYGKSAGYKRNEQMALYAKEDDGVLIAFWDGVSKGTKHMIDLANKHGLRVFIVEI